MEKMNFKKSLAKNTCIRYVNVIISILLILVAQTIANDLVAKFKNHLTVNIVSDASKQKMVETLLYEKAKIHPNLIYFVLKKVSLLGDSLITVDKRLVMISQIKAIELNYWQRRKQWADNQLAMMKQLGFSDDLNRVRKETEAYLVNWSKSGGVDNAVRGGNGLLESTEMQKSDGLPDNADLQINKSSLNYFVSSYYSKNGQPEFDPGIDYSIVRHSIEDSIRQRIQKSYQSISSGARGSRKYTIENFLNHWYLFEDNKTNGEEGESFYGYEFIAECIKNRLTKNNRSGFALGLSIYNKQYFELSNNFSITGAEGAASYKKTVGADQIGLSISYRHLFEQYVHFFSYLTLEGSFYVKGKMNPINLSPTYIRPEDNIEEPNFYISRNVTFDKSTITITSFNTYSVSILTPIFAWRNLVIFESGLTTTINNVEYSVQSQYDYRYVRSEYIPPFLITREIYTLEDNFSHENYRLSKTRIIPTINLNYLLSRKFDFTATAALDYVTVSVKYNFF